MDRYAWWVAVAPTDAAERCGLVGVGADFG
jgi:hypothetical protein